MLTKCLLQVQQHFGLANASFASQLVHRRNELSVANEKKWINKSQPSNVDSSLATNREFPPIQGSASLQFIQITHMMSMYNIFTDTCTRMGPDLLSALGRAKFNNYNENQMRDC